MMTEKDKTKWLALVSAILIVIGMIMVTGCSTHGEARGGCGANLKSNIQNMPDVPCYVEARFTHEGVKGLELSVRHDSHLDAGWPVNSDWDMNVNSIYLSYGVQIW